MVSLLLRFNSLMSYLLFSSDCNLSLINQTWLKKGGGAMAAVGLDPLQDLGTVVLPLLHV